MDSRPVHALLSQLIVAMTVEVDNEFERRMGEAGFPIRHSLALWLNIIRFLPGEPSLREIAARALADSKSVAPVLGCLERWRLVAFGASKRQGWGVRAGTAAPSLGRGALSPAARKRMRDLVAQTKAFLADPADALPHFPMWDMNRGFGP